MRTQGVRALGEQDVDLAGLADVIGAAGRAGTALTSEIGLMGATAAVIADTPSGEPRVMKGTTHETRSCDT